MVFPGIPASGMPKWKTILTSLALYFRFPPGLTTSRKFKLVLQPSVPAAHKPAHTIILNGFLNSLYDLRRSHGLRGQYVYYLRNTPSPTDILSTDLPLLTLPTCKRIGKKNKSWNRRPVTPGKMLVILRDGRKLHGVLRSYDQFGASPALWKSPGRGFYSNGAPVSLSSVNSESCPRRYSGTNTSRGCLCRELAWSISHPRRECSVIRRDCTLTNIFLLSCFLLLPPPPSSPHLTQTVKGLGQGRRGSTPTSRLPPIRTLRKEGDWNQERAGWGKIQSSLWPEGLLQRRWWRRWVLMFLCCI